MQTFFKDQYTRRIFLWLALLVLLLVLLFNPAVGFGGAAEEGMVRTGIVEIRGKTSDTIIVGERHFLVSESTRILDINGKEIPLIDLRVPCEAELKYRLIVDKKPVSLQVTVKRLFPHSSMDYMFQVREY
ncbi:MAG: hypothetical protein P8175_01310 [Deltaproteobacteria bacterium]